MQHYRCRCGKTTSVGSMDPPRCLGCEECGTRLVNVRYERLNDDRRPEPHDFQPRPVETDEGFKTLTRCRWCFDTPDQAQVLDRTQ